MSVPTFDQLLRPVLELASTTDITRQTAVASMMEVFKLTDEERQETIKSGATKISNRTGWAMSHLTKGGLISGVAKFTYGATEKGKNYLKTHVGPITKDDLAKVEGWREAWDAGYQKKAVARGEIEEVVLDETSTPEELIDSAMEILGDSLRSELLDYLLNVNPYRFERVVLDLLLKMGYGGSREEAAEVTKKSGDEGIDGVINEDRLGLDTIYVQAKRWKGVVGRPDVQGFVGALAGKQAHKGVFITTSGFTSDAIQFAKNIAQKVILIDGTRLADLMIEHGVGVSTVRTVSVKRIDSDYFEEG
jgi:restriction system protein